MKRRPNQISQGEEISNPSVTVTVGEDDGGGLVDDDPVDEITDIHLQDDLAKALAKAREGLSLAEGDGDDEEGTNVAELMRLADLDEKAQLAALDISLLEISSSSFERGLGLKMCEFLSIRNTLTLTPLSWNSF